MSSPSPPDPDAPDGRLLAGRYQLIRPIASGGMARVWEATDTVLGRPVAVKVLHPHLAADELFVARFRAEAVNAARLAHPGIVSIYDTWSGPDGEAIVMELVRGTTLRHLLDHRGPLQPDESVTIADHIATALQAAHQAGIVHRDIKPANVLLSSDGRVLVTDFGIAKAIEGSDLTTERTMLGTAKYLAPEQVEGTAVDGRTDLYALGVVLYEMVCGQVPFKAETEAATALARLHRLPDPPSTLRPGLSRSLDAVILRCLARRPEDRPQDAAELRHLLAGCDRRLGGTGPAAPDGGPPPPVAMPAPPAPVTTTPPPRRSRAKVGVAVLVAIAVLVGAALTAAISSHGRGAHALAIRGAVAFDPLGHPPGEENNALAHLAVDGDPSTSWSTERYRHPDRMGKPGVGLVVQLGTSARIDAVAVRSPSAGWNVDVFVLDRPPSGSDVTRAPDAHSTSIPAGATTIALGGRRASFVLLWITRTGDDGRVEVAEVTVTGR